MSRKKTRARTERRYFESLETRRMMSVNPAWFESIAYQPPVLSLSADANGSGSVDLADFALLKFNFGSTQATKETGDFDGDGRVSIGDFGILKNTFGDKDDVSEFTWQDETIEKVDNQWIVQLKRSVAETLSGPREAQPFFDDYGMTVLRGLGQVGLIAVETTTDDLFQLQAEFDDSGVVEYFEPDALTEAALIPDDPSFPALWGMTTINAPAAWDISVGDLETVVAVLDTGVDYDHEDLSDNMWVNPFEIAGNGVDDDGNGFTDDRFGYDFQDGDGDPDDDNSHGTHVAGTIAAVGNNGIGVTGVAPNVTLLPVKVLGSDGRGLMSTLASGINYVTRLRNDGVNVRIMNASLGGDSLDFSSVTDAVREAGDSDILLVAAAGNNGRNTDFAPYFPASLTNANVISVANTTSTDTLSGTSNFGVVSVDIGAPGTGVLSTTPNDTYGNRSGTSMATPHVSGAAALLLSVAPNAWIDEVRNQIFDSARPVPALAGNVATGGILEVSGALDGWTGGVALRPHFHLPPQVAGTDADFDGNGPEIELAAELRISADGQTLESRIFMDAMESGSSGTTQATGMSAWETAFVAPHGMKISAINSPTSSSTFFTDMDHEANIVSMPLTDMVHHYEIVGDTNGDDAGIKTGVRVYFRSPDLTMIPLFESSLGICEIPLQPIEFEPPLVRPDDDFDGNGPLMDAFVQLRVNDGDVEGRVHLHAQEWDSGRPRADFTTFDGWSDWQTLFTGNVARVLSPMQTERVFVDTDHLDDILTGDELVSQYIFQGDTDGGVFGGPDNPKVTVLFNDLLVQQPGCGGGAVPLRSHFFIPPAVGGGDLEFDGNGPEIDLFTEVRIGPDGQTLETRVTMSAQETGGGDTMADGVSGWETAYVAPAGQMITSLVSTATTSSLNFLDTDHAADLETMPLGNLVDHYEIVGDTNGEDAGIKTGVRVHYNPVNITVAPTGTIGETRVVSPRARFFAAPNVRPDEEFEGNGPLMDAFVQLRVHAGEVQARIHLHAQEWLSNAPRHDFTTFDGWSAWQSISVGQIPPGRQIKRVLGPMQSTMSYVDTDHGDDVFLGTDTLVAEYQFVGDRDQFIDGTDEPSVRVLFRDLMVELEAV